MAERFGGEKMGKKTEEKVRGVIEMAACETGAEIVMEETPDTFSIKVKDKEGNERKMGFMKILEMRCRLTGF